MPDLIYAPVFAERSRIVQQAWQSNILVLPNQPKRISTTWDDTQLITEWWVTNPTTVAPQVAVSVWLSPGPNVTSTAGTVLGIEVPPATTMKFHRRLYDTNLMIPTAPRPDMKLIQPPVVIWDLTQWWVISGPDPISKSIVVTAFPQVYL